jgi:putative transposase
MGLETFATLSNGEQIENPRFYKRAERHLRVAQRRMSRRKKGSSRRRKAVQILRKVCKRIFNQRNKFQNQQSRKLVNSYGLVFAEDLNVKGLAGSMLAKSVHDAGWANFIVKLAYKAENAGRTLMLVDPSGTSQRCLCGATVKKKLSDREHVCTKCGLIGERDHVSAMEILRLGLSLWESSIATRAVFSQEAPAFTHGA